MKPFEVEFGARSLLRPNSTPGAQSGIAPFLEFLRDWRASSSLSCWLRRSLSQACYSARARWFRCSEVSLEFIGARGYEPLTRSLYHFSVPLLPVLNSYSPGRRSCPETDVLNQHLPGLGAKRTDQELGTNLVARLSV